MRQKLYNRKFAKNGTQLKSVHSCGQSLGFLSSKMSKRVGGMSFFTSGVVLFLSSFCVCVLSTGPPRHEQYSKSTLFVNMKDPQVVRMEDRQEILRFGDKLRRKEVISRRKDTSIVGDSGELEIQLPDGGVKAPSGKTLNKMVIRTFKTTTSTTTEVPKSEHYYNHYYPNRNKKNKYTTTESRTTGKPQQTSSTGFGNKENQQVGSSGKSTTDSSTSQTQYNFPPYSKKDQNQKKNGGARQYILRSSLPAKSTTPYSTSTTVEVTSTKPTSTTEEKYSQSTEEPYRTTLTENTETTLVTSTSPPTSLPVRRPVKVVSKSLGTVITTVKDSSYVPATTAEPNSEEVKPSRKPIHYILAVIGPSTEAPVLEEQFEDETTTVRSEGEIPTPTSVSPTSSQIPEINDTPTRTPGPYDHLQTIEIPASAITEPKYLPFDVIPSLGNARPNYRPFSATRAPPTQFNYFDTQSFKQDVRSRGPEGSPQLIPLQTIVSYTPDNSRNINRLTPPQQTLSPITASRSPFVSSKTVLFYTQVSPKDGSNSNDFPKFSSSSGPSLNSIISPQEDQRGRIVSSSNQPISSHLNAVPARSFYLDNLRLPVPSSVFGKPIPLVLNYSSV